MGLDPKGLAAARGVMLSSSGILIMGEAFNATMEAAILAYLEAAPSPSPAPGVVIEDYYARQIEWSRETFGPALRTGGVIDHIRKELKEIEADPHDLSEWIDVIILAMDGFWRHGGSASDLMPRLLAKQQKNMARAWPDWRTMSEDRAIEHDRSGEALASLSQPAKGEREGGASIVDENGNTGWVIS